MGVWEERVFWGRLFQKELPFTTSKIKKKYNKFAETGRKRVISGSRDHHPGRNCVANAMECLPDPKTAKKNQNLKNPEKKSKIPDFHIFL